MNVTPKRCHCADLFAQSISELKTKASQRPDLAASYGQARIEVQRAQRRHTAQCESCLKAEAQSQERAA